MVNGVDLSDLKKVFEDIGSYFTNLDSLGKAAWIMITVGIILLVVGAFFW